MCIFLTRWKNKKKNQIGRKISGLNRCISNSLWKPPSERMERRFPWIDSMSKILSYQPDGGQVSRFLRFEKRWGGGGGGGVESRVDRINLSRLSILEPTKLNCSLSASIVGHPTFNDEFSSLRERVGRKLFVSRETKVFEEEYYFSL